MQSATKSKIMQILNSLGLKSPLFLQGESRFNFFKTDSKTREFSAKRTSVVYSGKLGKNYIIVKIYLGSREDFSKFKREIYCYQNLTKKYPLFGSHLPKIISYGKDPLAYIVRENVQGRDFGDWFKVKTINKEMIEKLLSLLELFNNKIKLPAYICSNFPKNINHFVIESERARKTIAILSHEIDGLWDRYRLCYKPIKKIFIKTKKGFVFGDFTPANVLLENKTNHLKFFDLEAVSNSSIAYDIAAFYFSFLTKPKLKNKFLNILKIRANHYEKNFFQLFNFFIIGLIFNNFSLVEKKYRRPILKELKERVELMDSWYNL